VLNKTLAPEATEDRGAGWEGFCSSRRLLSGKATGMWLPVRNWTWSVRALPLKRHVATC